MLIIVMAVFGLVMDWYKQVTQIFVLNGILFLSKPYFETLFLLSCSRPWRVHPNFEELPKVEGIVIFTDC